MPVLARCRRGERHSVCLWTASARSCTLRGVWACEYVWEPIDRYVRLDGLAAINRSDWQDAITLAVAVVGEVRPWESGPSRLRGVGVGFDGGDVKLVWTSA